MQFALDSAVTGYLWISLSQKAQRRPTEYDRFGGIGISMAGPSKSPSKPLLPEHSIHVLLLRANDLGFRAENLVAGLLSMAGTVR